MLICGVGMKLSPKVAHTLTHPLFNNEHWLLPVPGVYSYECCLLVTLDIPDAHEFTQSWSSACP